MFVFLRLIYKKKKKNDVYLKSFVDVYSKSLDDVYSKSFDDVYSESFDDVYYRQRRKIKTYLEYL